MCQLIRLQVVPDELDVVQFGCILATIRPCSVPERQGPHVKALLTWIGPLSSTNTTGLVLAKPFNTDDLLTCVRSALDLRLGRRGQGKIPSGRVVQTNDCHLR
jgi:hypothetical protein